MGEGVVKDRAPRPLRETYIQSQYPINNYLNSSGREGENTNHLCK
jgi:hypothetical protein